MGEQDDTSSAVSCSVGNQAVADAARRSWQAGRGFGAGPAQSAPIGRDVAGGAFGEIGPPATVRSKAMIDSQGQQAAAIGLRPVGRETQQSDGIAAAG